MSKIFAPSYNPYTGPQADYWKDQIFGYDNVAKPDMTHITVKQINENFERVALKTTAALCGIEIRQHESNDELKKRIILAFNPFGKPALGEGIKLEFPDHPVPRFTEKKRENMKSTYKLTILYDNGKKFIVNGVFKHGFTYKNDIKQGAVKDKFKYSFYNKTSKALTDVEIPARDIAALIIKKANSILVEQYKPCAKISGGAEKRENNNKLLKASK